MTSTVTEPSVGLPDAGQTVLAGDLAGMALRAHQNGGQGAAFEEKVPALAILGKSIFGLLLAAVAVLFGSLFVFAAMTYPDANSVSNLVGDASNVDRLGAWEASQAAWSSRVKDLGTTFLVTPILPLLGLTIGYIFGQNAQSATSG